MGNGRYLGEFTRFAVSLIFPDFDPCIDIINLLFRSIHMQRRDSFSLYPEEFIAAKRDFVTTLSSLLTEKASIHQDANVSQLKVTKALDKILEKIKEDACAWVCEIIT